MAKRRLRPELVRQACQLYFGGLSFEKVAKELKFGKTTIATWSETDIWKEEWERLEQLSKQRREQAFLGQMDSVDEVADVLSRFSLEAMEGCLQSQKAISATLENINIPATIDSLEELATAIRTMETLTRVVQQSFDNFSTAVELQEFLQENQQAPTLTFEEYTPEEIEAIRGQV